MPIVIERPPATSAGTCALLAHDDNIKERRYWNQYQSEYERMLDAAEPEETA
jgi:hypothetical protein